MTKRLVLERGGHAQLSVLRSLAKTRPAGLDVVLITPQGTRIIQACCLAGLPDITRGLSVVLISVHWFRPLVPVWCSTRLWAWMLRGAALDFPMVRMLNMIRCRSTLAAKPIPPGWKPLETAVASEATGQLLSQLAAYFGGSKDKE